jgi:hypothetical protein
MLKIIGQSWYCLGFGIGKGDILDVPGTWIHISDEINTASKIAEDLAVHGEIFFTENVRHFFFSFSPAQFIVKLKGRFFPGKI